MSTKPFDRAAFGSQSARFTLNGVHPNLLYTGRMPYDSKTTAPVGAHLGPGSYDQLKYSEFSEVNVNKKADGPNWDRALLTEKLAKMPNLLYQETHKKKLEDKRRVGPGYYFQDGYSKSTKPTSTRGMLDQLSDRFAYIKPNDNPGPSEYGIPDEILEEKRKNKPGTVPSFERSKESRSLPMVGSEVPPGTYKHKNSIDELLKKKVSIRGPYDLFTDERSGPPKTGHFIEDSNPILGPGSYELRSFVDDLTNYAHVKHGKFGKIEQRPIASGERISINYTSLNPRNPAWPGPGYYDPIEISKVNSNPPPFLISSIRDDKRNTKAFNKNYNKVGVGRYDITRPDATIHIASHKSIFVSKSAQITKEKDKKFLAERIRPMNLDNNEKMTLYLTGNVRTEIEARA